MQTFSNIYCQTKLQQNKATPLPWGHIIEHTTSIVCTIIVTNLIENILLL